MADLIVRLAVRTMPKSGKLTAAAGKVAHDHAMVHLFRRAAGQTACGRSVSKGDKRWVVKRGGFNAEVTCKRCISKATNPNVAPLAGSEVPIPRKRRIKYGGALKRAAVTEIIPARGSGNVAYESYEPAE